MRIALVNPPGSKPFIRDNYCSFTSKANYYWPPIDLVVLSGILGEAHDLLVLDATVEQLPVRQALERLTAFGPDVVIAVTGTASWDEDRRFLQAVWDTTHPRIFLSGGFLLTEGERFLRDEPFLEGVLLNYLVSGIERFLEDPTSRPLNLIYRQTSGEVLTVRSPLPRDVRVPPGQHRLFPLERYRIPSARSRPMTCLTMSVGCPFSCSFCISSIVKYGYRDLDNVMEELESLQGLGVKEIFFSDQTFTANQRRVEEFCARVRERKISFSWTCQTHVSCVSRQTLSAMKAAGCHTVHFGVETGNQEILDRYQKQADLQMIRNAFQLAREVGLQTLGYFIIGLPGETFESSVETIRFATELDPDYTSFSFATPDIGTRLAEDAHAHGWNNGADRFDSSADAVMETERLSLAQSRRLMRHAFKSFYLRPRYLWRSLCSIRSWYQLENLVLNGWALTKHNLTR